MVFYAYPSVSNIARLCFVISSTCSGCSLNVNLCPLTSAVTPLRFVLVQKASTASSSVSIGVSCILDINLLSANPVSA